ncbi:biotin/lipoyl-containing protein, partial [Streptomyces calidiresistens]
MAEVREFLLPDLGEGLPGAEIVRWLVEVGDAVAVDQPVVEVETAKAQVEVPCPWAGVITARHGDEGEEVPVGAPLVAVAVGAAPGAAPAPAADPGEGPGADTDASRGGSGRVLVGYGTADPAVRDGSGGRRARRSRAFALVGAGGPATPAATGANGSRPAP